MCVRECAVQWDKLSFKIKNFNLHVFMIKKKINVIFMIIIKNKNNSNKKYKLVDIYIGIWWIFSQYQILMGEFADWW